MTIFLTLLALAFSVFSTFCSMTFYSSFGFGIYAYSWGFAGLIMDLLKYASVKMFSDSLTQSNRGWERLGLITMWLVTSCLSLIAGYGFVSTAIKQYEDAEMLKSNIYNSRLLSQNNARSKVDSLAQFADASNADAARNEKNRLENELAAFRNSPAKNGRGIEWGTIGARTGDCSQTRSYYVKAYCPTINKLQQDIATQDELIRGHLRYTSASSYLEKTSFALSELTSAGSTTHVGFQNLGHALGISPITLKNWVVLVITIVLEIGSSFVIHMSNRLYHQYFPSYNGEGNNQMTKFTPNGYEPRREVAIKTPSVHRLPFMGNSGAKLFKNCEKAVRQHIIAPSRYGIRKWLKQTGYSGSISDTTIKSWQAKMLESGLVEEYTYNGKHTYRLL